MAIRSGRFKSADASAGIPIIIGRSGLFRIFNAGDDEFTVRPQSSGATNDVNVAKDCSVDVKVLNSCTVTGGVVDGIYDFVGESRKIRTGRFKGDAATAVKIAQEADGRFYRIYNSGDADITIEPTGTTLKPTFSIDISTGGNITVQGSGIECIYDVLTGERDIRSGRFNIKVPMNAYPHKIIDLSIGGGDGWYRLYNSGETPIVLVRGSGGGAQEFAEVDLDQSVDFMVQSARDIFVRPKVLTEKIAGIYEYLGS